MHDPETHGRKGDVTLTRHAEEDLKASKRRWLAIKPARELRSRAGGRSGKMRELDGVLI